MSEKPTQFICNKCNKSYTSSVYLNKHISTCNGLKKQDKQEIKEFKCNICSKVFANESNKIRHTKKCANKKIQEIVIDITPTVSDIDLNDADINIIEVYKKLAILQQQHLQFMHFMKNSAEITKRSVFSIEKTVNMMQNNFAEHVKSKSRKTDEMLIKYIESTYPPTVNFDRPDYTYFNQDKTIVTPKFYKPNIINYWTAMFEAIWFNPKYPPSILLINPDTNDVFVSSKNKWNLEKLDHIIPHVGLIFRNLFRKLSGVDDFLTDDEVKLKRDQELIWSEVPSWDIYVEKRVKCYLIMNRLKMLEKIEELNKMKTE